MKKLNINMLKKIGIILGILVLIVLLVVFAENWFKEKNNDKVSLIINNRNVTERLKNELKFENGILYISMEDMQNFFDKYIYLEEETNEVITTYDNKIASIGFDSNKMLLNGAVKKINASAIKSGETIYIPISEMLEVYNIELKNIEETKIITLDSLDREQIKATLKGTVSLKSQGKIFSKTVSKAQKDTEVILIDKTEGKKWVKVRAENGKIGYVKVSKLENIETVREKQTKEKQISGKVNIL